MTKKLLSMTMAVLISLGSMLAGLTASADGGGSAALVQETPSDIETPAETPSDTDTATDTETDTDFPAGTEKVQGDITSDGKLDISDLVLLRAAIIGNKELEADEAKAADVNGDGELSIMDVVLMRSLIVNGDNTIPDTGTDIDTDPQTDTDTDTSTDTEKYDKSRVPEGYTFLDVDEARIEKAYRAVIEYSITGIHPTAEYLRIVQEDCVKYVLASEDEIVKTFIFDPTLNCDNAAYYTGVVASNFATYGYSVSNGWHWEYETNPKVYASAYPDFRRTCRNYVNEFIPCVRVDGWTDEELKSGVRFNYSYYCSDPHTYVINFVYG